MERMGCRLLHMPKEAEYGTLHTTYEDGSIRRHALSTEEQGRRTIVGSTGSAVHYSNNLWLPSTRTFN